MKIAILHPEQKEKDLSDKFISWLIQELEENGHKVTRISSKMIGIFLAMKLRKQDLILFTRFPATLWIKKLFNTLKKPPKTVWFCQELKLLSNENDREVHEFVIQNHVNHTITTSQYLADLIKEFYNEKPIILPLALSNKWLSSIPQNREANIITCVGELVEERNLFNLLKALVLVLESEPTLKLRLKILGSGPLKKELVEKIKKMNLEDNIYLYDKFSHEIVEQAYQEAMLVIDIPLRSQYSFSPLFGGLFRKPVIASRSGAIAELVEEGKTGFLVDPRNPAEIALKIIKLAKDPAKRKAMGEHARKNVLEKHSLKNYIAKLEEVAMWKI